MRLRFPFAFAALLAFPGLRAQPFQGSLAGGIGLSIPTGEFANTYGTNMFAVNAHLAVPMHHLPLLQVGFDFGYAILGSQSADVHITSDYQGITEGQLTTRSKVFSYHPLIRLSPARGKLRPYGDLMAGFRQFSTVSKVTADGFSGSVSRERNSNDVVFSTGWAVGLQYAIAPLILVEARVQHFSSGRATYVDPNSITISDQGSVAFGTLTSGTDVTNVIVGIGLRF